MRPTSSSSSSVGSPRAWTREDRRQARPIFRCRATYLLGGATPRPKPSSRGLVPVPSVRRSGVRGLRCISRDGRPVDRGVGFMSAAWQRRLGAGNPGSVGYPRAAAIPCSRPWPMATTSWLIAPSTEPDSRRAFMYCAATRRSRSADRSSSRVSQAHHLQRQFCLSDLAGVRPSRDRCDWTRGLGQTQDKLMRASCRHIPTICMSW